MKEGFEKKKIPVNVLTYVQKCISGNPLNYSITLKRYHEKIEIPLWLLPTHKAFCTFMACSCSRSAARLAASFNLMEFSCARTVRGRGCVLGDPSWIICCRWAQRSSKYSCLPKPPLRIGRYFKHLAKIGKNPISIECLSASSFMIAKIEIYLHRHQAHSTRKQWSKHFRKRHFGICFWGSLLFSVPSWGLCSAQLVFQIPNTWTPRWRGGPKFDKIWGFLWKKLSTTYDQSLNDQKNREYMDQTLKKQYI